MFPSGCCTWFTPGYGVRACPVPSAPLPAPVGQGCPKSSLNPRHRATKQGLGLSASFFFFWCFFSCHWLLFFFLFFVFWCLSVLDLFRRFHTKGCVLVSMQPELSTQVPRHRDEHLPVSSERRGGRREGAEPPGPAGSITPAPWRSAPPPPLSCGCRF